MQKIAVYDFTEDEIQEMLESLDDIENRSIDFNHGRPDLIRIRIYRGEKNEN